MENLKKIKEKLETTVLSQLDNGIENVDTKEMEMACDMIKDIADAMYHCTLIEAMNKSEYGKDYTEEGPYRFYTPYPHQMGNDMMGEMDYSSPRMRQGRPTHTTPSRMYYTENNTGYMGKSGDMRRKYFESSDPTAKMQSLEDYTKTLHEDLSEMVSSASDNEKAMLKNKLQMIAQRL